MSTEKLTTPTITEYSLSASISWYGNSNFCLVVKGSCLKQTKKKNNTTYTPANRIIFFIVHELDTWSRDLNTDTLTLICIKYFCNYTA